MSIATVIILSAPVLYMTGSLRRSTSAAGIDGACFVLYFAVGALLSLLPPVQLAGGVFVSLPGAFMCIAPACYLIVQKEFIFRFYLAAMLTVLIAVTASFLTISYTISFLSAALVFVVSLAALLLLKNKAPVYAPVMAGIYGVTADIMALLTETVRTVTAFDVLDVASVSFAVCLLVTYLLSHPWHKSPAVQT